MDRDMSEVVCTCLGTTVQDLADAIANGASSFDEVVAATDVTTICGVCEDSVREIVDELLEK